MDNWNGEDLEGLYFITLKLDGVQVIYKDGVPKSRAGKELYNLPAMPDGKYEVYKKDFKTTISAVRTHDGDEIDKSFLFNIEPLNWTKGILMVNQDGNQDGLHINPKKELIKGLLDDVTSKGIEGLILTKICPHNGIKQIKVKPFETHDVLITGIQEGTNKNVGKLGAFETDMGKVGTGFTDAQRVEFFNKDLIGDVIEVKCMHLTEDGKFRHPTFLHFRPDKTIDN